MHLVFRCILLLMTIESITSQAALCGSDVHTALLQHDLILPVNPVNIKHHQPSYVSTVCLMDSVFLCNSCSPYWRLSKADTTSWEQTDGKKRLIEQCRHSEVEKRLDTRTFQSHLNQSLNIQRMAAAWYRVLVVVVLLMSLLGSTAAVGGAVSRPRPQRRPPKKPKVEPIDVTPPAPDIDIQQVRNWRHRQKSSTLCALSWFVFFSDNVIRHFL